MARQPLPEPPENRLGDYDAEMKEFAKMEDGIKDMDWYKAETQAARNGHETAMAFAEAKGAEANAWQAKAVAWQAKFYGLIAQHDKQLSDLRTGFIILLIVVFILGTLIGAWLF